MSQPLPSTAVSIAELWRSIDEKVRQDSAVYWLLYKPTIAELRRLNRESLMPFPLPMLCAIADAGIDTEAESDATVEWYVHHGDIIEVRWAIKQNGKVIAIIGESGVDGFRGADQEKALIRPLADERKPMLDPEPSALDELADTILAQFQPLSDEGRLHVLSRLNERYCDLCGKDMGDTGYCGCEFDR